MKSIKRASGSLRAATIRDVAARVGVSVATISRVFNSTAPVRETVRQRVLEAAQELNYVPHAAARSLSTRSTATIGVVLPDLHGEFFSEVIRGIDLSAREAGFHILVSGSHADRAEMRAVLAALRGRVDGLIVMSPDLETRTLVSDLPHGLPIVVLNSAVDGWPSITIDNYGGARDVVKHLVSLGHRRIAFVGGPSQNVDAGDRVRGYRAGMRSAGLDPLELDGLFTEESGHEAARILLRSSPRPTAIFSANDAMAIGALSAFREAGVDVPDDVALVGFDDVPIARYLAPPLTTVAVPIAELGRSAFEVLHALTLGEATPANRKLKTALVVRESCGSARVGRSRVAKRRG
ncbi:MAG: LacI family DNA-binding transcriptional regulator [Thermoanaerobaculia bacterium]